MRTYTLDLRINPRTHDLVPSKDCLDEQATAFKAAGAAEGVDEFGVGGEVGVDGVFLLFGRALDEFVDYAWGVADGVVHCCGVVRRYRIAREVCQ